MLIESCCLEPGFHMGSDNDRGHTATPMRDVGIEGFIENHNENTVGQRRILDQWIKIPLSQLSAAASLSVSGQAAPPAGQS